MAVLGPTASIRRMKTRTMSDRKIDFSVIACQRDPARWKASMLEVLGAGPQ
jgi:hypothetical protein